MRPARLVILALVVLGLAAYIFFVERHAPTTDELKQRADKVFPGLKSAEVKRLVITGPKGHFELVKEKDTWKLEAPLKDDAKESAVSSLLGSLESLKAESSLDAKDLKLADYGLETPALQLQLVTEAGLGYQLRLGAELPLGNSRAALAGGDKVLLIGKWIANDLDKDLAAWRSDQLARISADDVAAINVTAFGVRVALAHTGSSWTLTEPVADLADRERAESLVSDLNGALIKEFLDQPPPLAELGLEPRRLDVTVVRRGENAQPIVLELGHEREVAGSKQVACRRGERVFWVDASAVKNLQGAPADWRARKLVYLDTWSADSLEVEAGGTRARVERKDGLWKAGAVEVEFSAVSSRLNLLANLEVRAFDQPRPSAPALGTVKAVSAGATTEASFYPGTADGQALAVVAGRPGALAVDLARVTDLLADPASLSRPKPTPTPEPSASPADTPTATPPPPPAS